MLWRLDYMKQRPRLTRQRLAVLLATMLVLTVPVELASAQESQPPATAWANFDFVPGEKVLFAEDFTKDRVGNFPQRQELGSGNAEVVQWSGKPWLRFTSSTQFRVKLPQVLPQRFTVEFDLTMPLWGIGFTPEKLSNDDASGLGSGAAGEFAHVFIQTGEAGIVRGKAAGGATSSVDPGTLIPNLAPEGAKANKVVRVRLQVDGKYAKLYLDDKRIANIPNAEFARTDQLLFVVNDPETADEKLGTLITNLSINAGGPELYDALVANGRVATQGIYFDTGSDRIRPESAGTLKQIADMLRTHGDLKLLIEGHTDNVGDAAANLAWSDKRAAAVTAALVAQHSVDAARLQTKGLGMTKPVSPNTTAEGRQNNRRVELVKQ
jgi:outer membrane protein OmpA-like peptidoglycan-associated protein